MQRGARNRCPQCGGKPLFKSYLKPHHACASCGLEFHHQRADDAPPYFVMLIVGHVIVPIVLTVEMAWRPPIWVHLAAWLPLALLLALTLLPIIKGSLIGLQWAKHMHGFGQATDAAIDPTYLAPEDLRP